MIPSDGVSMCVHKNWAAASTRPRDLTACEQHVMSCFITKTLC